MFALVKRLLSKIEKKITTATTMDRTAIFNSTTFFSSKKPTEINGYTENFLCDEIHSNLRALSFLVPFTSDLKMVFDKV